MLPSIPYARKTQHTSFGGRNVLEIHIRIIILVAFASLDRLRNSNSGPVDGFRNRKQTEFMRAVCLECNCDGDHPPFSGPRPEFAKGFEYLICSSCGAVFNPHNTSSAYMADATDICETLTKNTGVKLACYIFGPGSPGTDGAFLYEFEKRKQLRESLPGRPVLKGVIEWAKFPEEDLPTKGRSPTGPLSHQEARLVERSRKKGLYPILIFIVASPGPIAELNIVSKFPENSLVFVKDRLEPSFIGQDQLTTARLNGAQTFFYPQDSGCALRAFATDFVSEKLEAIVALLDEERRVKEKLNGLGIKRKRRRGHAT